MVQLELLAYILYASHSWHLKRGLDSGEGWTETPPTMAVVDEDTFSNIPWNNNSNASGVSGSSSSAPTIEAEPPTVEDQHHDADLQRQDPGLSGDILECTVSEPRKEQDGTKDAFVSYLITTNVSRRISNYRTRIIQRYQSRMLNRAFLI